jgi:hypothetical protein
VGHGIEELRLAVIMSVLSIVERGLFSPAVVLNFEQTDVMGCRRRHTAQNTNNLSCGVCIILRLEKYETIAL